MGFNGGWETSGVGVVSGWIRRVKWRVDQKGRKEGRGKEEEDEEKDVPGCAGDEDPGACHDGTRVAYLRLEG